MDNSEDVAIDNFVCHQEVLLEHRNRDFIDAMRVPVLLDRFERLPHPMHRDATGF